MPQTLQFTLQQLKALNSFHGELHIRVSKRDNVFTISAQDRDTFTYDEFTDQLKRTLAHYPNKVTVNGETLETTPCPNLAHATITSYSQDYERAHSFRPISLEPHTDRASDYNAIAGGVLAYMPGLTQRETTYFTPGQQTMPHWQRADRVQLHPQTVITPGEVNELTNDELQLINSIPPYRQWESLDHPSRAAVPSRLTNLMLDWQQRAQEQAEKTLQHPNAPPKHQGQVFNHAVVPPHEDLVPYSEGSPLIAHGTPLLIEEFQDNRGDYISIAHALYQEDRGLVPVAFTSEQYNNPPDHQALADYSFTHRLADQPEENRWCIKMTEEITLDLHLDTDEEEHITVTAPFHLSGNTWNKKVYILAAQVDPETLAEKMAYAYWDINEHSFNGETNENFDQLNEEMSRLVTAALGDPDKAFQEQLQEYASRFRTDLPWPKGEIAARSYDGRITVIYQPKDN